MKHGVLGSYDNGDDTILYMEPVFSLNSASVDHPFAQFSSAGDQVRRPWMFFEQTLLVPDKDGNAQTQVYELEVLVLNEDEFVGPEEFTNEYDDRMLVRLKGRLVHFRFGRCKYHVIATAEQRGGLGLYFPMGFADDRVDWIAKNTTGAWSMRVVQPLMGNQRFALEFSFSSERDAVLFKTWWCG